MLMRSRYLGRYRCETEENMDEGQVGFLCGRWRVGGWSSRSNRLQVFCSGFSAAPAPASTGAVRDFAKGASRSAGRHEGGPGGGWSLMRGCSAIKANGERC